MGLTVEDTHHLELKPSNIMHRLQSWGWKELSEGPRSIQRVREQSWVQIPSLPGFWRLPEPVICVHLQSGQALVTLETIPIKRSCPLKSHLRYGHGTWLLGPPEGERLIGETRGINLRTPSSITHSGPPTSFLYQEDDLLTIKMILIKSQNR